MSKNTSFVLGEHFDRLIQTQLKSGRYASATEVVREALRHFEAEKEKEAWVEEALAAGVASGRARPGVFRRVRAKQGRR